MITPFKGGNKITQEYGKRPAYYAQWGLLGHEGLDLVPLDGNRDIFCIEGGEIIRDQDDPIAGKAYGNNVVIWNKVNNRAWYYCHLASNNVSLKQTIRRGDKIGVMGATGNTQGAHLHVNLCDTDSNGTRLNQDNGYLGFINPLSTIDKLNIGDIIIPQSIDTMDYKSIWDKTGDIQHLENRSIAPSFYAPDDQFKKAYVDSSTNRSYVVLDLKSVNDTLTSLRDIIQSKTVEISALKLDIQDLIANDPLAPNVNMGPIEARAVTSGSNIVVEPPVELKPVLGPLQDPTIDIIKWFGLKIKWFKHLFK